MLSRRATHSTFELPRALARLGVLLTVVCALTSASVARALPLEIVTNTLAGGTAGVPYSATIVADLGTTPYVWTLDSGTLPSGITLDGSTGALDGTATLAGSYPFIVLVTDALGDTATRALSIAIAPGAPAAITFTVEPAAVAAGVAIAPAVQVRVTDALGNGVAGESVALALVGSGVLSGGGAVITDGSGVASFAALSIDVAGSKQLTATSGVLAPATSAAFTVSAGAPAAIAFTVEPSNALVGAVISPPVLVEVLDGFGNPVAGESVSLALAGTGLLSGGSAVLTDVAGIATFAGLSVDHAGVAQLTASSGVLAPVSSASFTLGCPVVTLAPATIPAAQLGASYSQAISASGGVAPYSFALTAGALPAGLTLSGAGLLSGTPSASGLASLTVTATDAAGCTGTLEYTLSVEGVPAAVTDLAAVRLTSGNDGDGTSLIQITFPLSAFAVSAEVYRAPFGGYPRYDDAGGVLPPTPAYPPGSPWVLTSVSASGQTDEPASRDAWSYVVFLKNSFAQVSGVSNKTAPVPNYALGDVSNGLAPATGDNLVDDADISRLGAFYGLSGSALTTNDVHDLDVGPTVDLAVTSRPFTDDRLDFEDLIVYATNYGAVSAPGLVAAQAAAAARSAAAPERLTVSAPSLVEAGATFFALVHIEAAGRVQGLSAELEFDAAIAEPMTVESAGWLESQQGVVLSAAAGTFDAVLLGARSRGLTGAGDLARVTFRALRTGDPAVGLKRVRARDAANRALAASDLAFGRDLGVPTRTQLLAPSPNPSRGDAVASFALAHRGTAELAIYGVDGRRVRVLARGAFAAGTYRFAWNGSDDQQRAVAPGVYFVQLLAGGKRFTRTIVHLQ